ncbi:zinc finger protein 131 isoform X3 [Rana temporaria]|uniref:zinc finger protein 131 isoform X3 n=1 Tax=Rana temporaria TaxID=8407 RepID=UPI001AAD077E|nr:zinc finger protein 131 isoform X3 [Rana temporaria]
MEAEETMGCIQEFPDHYKVMMDRLNEQREHDQFTDITLIVDGVGNIAFKHLIEFTYTAKLMLQGEEEASDIYKAAEYLQMHEAIKALEIRTKETDFIEGKPEEDESLKKWDVEDSSGVLSETMPSPEGEPVEIEVEIAEGTIELDENIEALEAVTSSDQSVKYIEATGTSDDSALALLADITSKYRQGERKRQLQEDLANENDAAGKQEHMKTHTADNFKCEICNKSYVREVAWKQHLTCYHLDESGSAKRPKPGKKIHVCQYCDKQFDHFGHFKEHLRKHTGEKPFECPNCHEHFARNSTLKCHLSACQYGVGAKKGRKKLYECQVCNSVFNCWDQFKDHLVLHTGDKPNHCTLCDLWFMQGSELRKHLREIHNISERIVTEVMLPSDSAEMDTVPSMTFVEQVEQVHVVPVDQVIQVQVDPPQLTVGQLHQDLLEVNQVKGTHILDLQTQVHMGHIEVEHLQIDPGTEVHVEEVHVNQIHMEEVEAELLDETNIHHIEHAIEEHACHTEEAELHQIVHTGAENLQIRQLEITHLEAAAE